MIEGLHDVLNRLEAKIKQANDEITRLKKENEELSNQINNLANFIMTYIPGEPSQSEGAVVCAVRIMRKLKARVEELRKEVDEQTAMLSHWTSRVSSLTDGLRKYGDHSGGCHAFSIDHVCTKECHGCTCGYSNLIESEAKER